MRTLALVICIVRTAVALQVKPHFRRSSSNYRQSVRTNHRNIVCGWGPEPIWHLNSITSISDAAEGLKAITISPPGDVAEGFATPGQYVQIREPGAEKAGFFAIASAPGAAGDFQFLIKEQPPSDWSPGTGWLTSAPAGTALEMSQVMGTGFKVTGTLGDVDTVVLFAAGSGISPIRSVIESGVLKGKDTQLYYGAQTPAKMAYMDKFTSWESLGCAVTPVVSQPPPEWAGAIGYVQDVAKGAGISKPESTAVLLCGMKGMAMGVKELCAGVGIDESRVLTNF